MRLLILVVVLVMSVVIVVIVVRLRLRQRRRRRGLQLGFLARSSRSSSRGGIIIGFTVSLTTIASWFGFRLLFFLLIVVIRVVLVLLSTRPASPSRHSTAFGSIRIAHFHVDRRALFFGDGIGGRVCRHGGDSGGSREMVVVVVR